MSRDHPKCGIQLFHQKIYFRLKRSNDVIAVLDCLGEMEKIENLVVFEGWLIESAAADSGVSLISTLSTSKECLLEPPKTK